VRHAVPHLSWPTLHVWKTFVEARFGRDGNLGGGGRKREVNARRGLQTIQLVRKHLSWCGRIPGVSIAGAPIASLHSPPSRLDDISLQIFANFERKRGFGGGTTNPCSQDHRVVAETRTRGTREGSGEALIPNTLLHMSSTCEEAGEQHPIVGRRILPFKMCGASPRMFQWQFRTCCPRGSPECVLPPVSSPRSRLVAPALCTLTTWLGGSLTGIYGWVTRASRKPLLSRNGTVSPALYSITIGTTRDQQSNPTLIASILILLDTTRHCERVPIVTKEFAIVRIQTMFERGSFFDDSSSSFVVWPGRVV